MNHVKQLSDVSRQVDSLTRRLDITFDEWAGVTTRCIAEGRIPTPDDFASLITEDEPRPALAKQVQAYREDQAAIAKAKADAAVREANEAAERAGAAS